MEDERLVEERLMPIMDLASDIPYDATEDQLQDIVDVMKESNPRIAPILEKVVLDPRTRKPALAYMRVAKRYMQSVVDAHENGKDIGICSFNFPPEIFHAMDIVPISTEALTSLASIFLKAGAEPYIDKSAEYGIPETMCSAQRGQLGAILSGLGVEPEFVVSASLGSCDTNAKIYEFFSEYMDIPFFGVDNPPYVDESGKEYYRQEVRRLISFLEEETGRDLDKEKLKETIENSEEIDRYYADLYDLRKSTPNPVPSAYNVFMHGTKYMGSGIPGAVSVFERMYNVAKERMKEGKGASPEEKLRAAWIHTGYYFPNLKLWTWHEQNGYSYLMDGTSWFAVRDYEWDTSSIDGMIDSLADEAFNYPMTRQLRGPYDYKDDWLDDCIRILEDLDADCAIFCGRMACKNSWGAVRPLKRGIKEETGLPVHILEADAWDERITPFPQVKEELKEFYSTVVL